MVLDGALDPRASTLELNLVQAQGLRDRPARLRRRLCRRAAAASSASPSTPAPSGSATFLDASSASPCRPRRSAQLDVGNAVSGSGRRSTTRAAGRSSTRAPQSAFAGDGTTLLSLADAYVSRGPRRLLRTTPSRRFYAVNCLDHDDAVPSDRGARTCVPRFEKASPTFGAIFAYSLSGCAQWPVHTGTGRRAITRQGRAADPGGRHHPRPGDPAGVGRGAGRPAGVAACWSVATATVTPATTPGNTVRRPDRRVLPVSAARSRRGTVDC